MTLSFGKEYNKLSLRNKKAFINLESEVLSKILISTVKSNLNMYSKRLRSLFSTSIIKILLAFKKMEL